MHAGSRRRRNGRRKSSRSPKLTFSPYAWAKFRHLRDVGPTEIGGFGISSAADPLFIEDVVLVKQTCSVVTVAFQDEAVADYFEQMVDRGMQPDQFARVWLHTHPGCSAMPSAIDEATFARAFGRNDWAVMGILARNDRAYARLQYRVGPGGSWQIPVRVDFGQPFSSSDAAAWEAEYAESVRPQAPQLPVPSLLNDRLGLEPRLSWEEENHLWF